MQLALLIVTASTLAVMVVAAGLCFAPHGRGTPGCHLVKVTGPVTVTLVLAALVITADPDPVAGGVAIALLVLGLGLFLWAIAAHRGSRLTRVYAEDAPQRLVAEGPYRWVRHPCYTSYLIAFSSGLVATGRWWLVPVVAGNLVLYAHAAWFEEKKFLRSPLSEAYAAYQSRTGMFLPNPLKRIVK